MCVTLNESDLGLTHILVNPVKHPTTGKTVHATFYQNEPQNLSEDPLGVMILPIPSAETMSSANFIDCRGADNILKEYAELIPDLNATRGMCFLGGGDGYEIFTSGSYTVILAKDPSYETVLAALSSLPPELRPNISKSAKIFDFYASVYRGWHLAVCIWQDSLEAEPIGYWYEPLAPNTLFVPGLDAHNGGVPENMEVDINHVVMVGKPDESGVRKNAEHVWRAAPDSLKPWLPKAVTGSKMKNDYLRNGDWILPMNPSESDYGRRVWPLKGLLGS